MLGMIRIALNRWHDNDAPVLSDHLRYHKVCGVLIWIFDDLMIWYMMILGYGDDAVPVSLFYEVYAMDIYVYCGFGQDKKMAITLSELATDKLLNSHVDKMSWWWLQW